MALIDEEGTESGADVSVPGRKDEGPNWGSGRGKETGKNRKLMKKTTDRP